MTAVVRGYAGALRGYVLVKTVSECARGAMVNTLALEMDLWAKDSHSDAEVRAAWLAQVAKLPHYSIVVVSCAPVGQPLDCEAVDMRASPAESAVAAAAPD